MLLLFCPQARGAANADKFMAKAAGIAALFNFIGCIAGCFAIFYRVVWIVILAGFAFVLYAFVCLTALLAFKPFRDAWPAWGGKEGAVKVNQILNWWRADFIVRRRSWCRRMRRTVVMRWRLRTRSTRT